MVLRNSFFTGLFGIVLSVAWLVSARAADKPRAWPPNQFLPLTDARVAALPEAERVVWNKYLEASRKLAAAVPARTEPDFSPTEPLKAPLSGAKHTKGLRPDAAEKWYASEEACALASRVCERQTLAGGWPKGLDYSGSANAEKAASDVWSAGTFDNDATIMELRFLTRVITASAGDPRAGDWRATFLKGLGYVFSAQYPNGGFPQIYPLVGGYHDAVTYNDNAMTRILELLRDIAAGESGFSFVPVELRSEAARRLALGIDCLLKTQIVEPSGRRMVWCQQYDMLTLKPCAARNFEPIAASSAESARLVLFLMEQRNPGPETTTAIASAVDWFRNVQLKDLRWVHSDKDAVLERVTGAAPLWARFYEIETDKPLFGDRDKTIHYAVSEISAERRHGYGWYGDWPAACFAAYKKWSVDLNSSVKKP
jgi:PelA/Pel-15E family pectate lyase